MNKPCILCSLDHAKLLGWALNICHCQEDDAKDLLHDTYLKLGQLPTDRQREIKDVELFISTTMKNLWLDRKKKVAPQLVEIEPYHASTTMSDDDCLKLLSRLPDAEREAFILYIENERNLSKVIRRTHIPRIRLKKIVESARKKMEICG